MLKPERQVWPSRWPRATIIAVLIPVALLWGFWDNLRPSFTPLQSYYLSRYLRSAATGWLGLKNGNSLIYVLTDRNTARPALNGEVIPMPGSIRAMDPKAVPLFLTRRTMNTGGVKLRELPVKSVTPNQLTTSAEFHEFLGHFIYGHSLFYFFRWSLLLGAAELGAAASICRAGTIYKDGKRPALVCSSEGR